MAILLPKSYYVRFLLSGLTTDSIISWIRQLNRELDDKLDKMARDYLVQICKHEGMGFSSRIHMSATKIVAELIKSCEKLRDPQLLLELVRACAKSRPGSPVYKAIAQFLHSSKFLDVEPRWVLSGLTTFSL